MTTPDEQVHEQADTPDADQQASQGQSVAEPEHNWQEQDPAQAGTVQEQPVTVERSGPEQVDPAGQPGSQGDTALPYGQVRDPAAAGEREGNQQVVGATEPVAAAQPVGATANESPVLPAGAQAGAAKAHAILGHLVKVAQMAQNEIERYVPPELLAAAERDALLFVRSVI